MNKGKPKQNETYLLIGGADDKCISNGNTWAESKMKKCPRCNGAMRIVDMINGVRYSEDGKMPCPDCEGEGEVEEGDDIKDIESAYKLGYADGYEEGAENNPYHHMNQRENFLQYLKGYDEGVAEYCRKEDEWI